MFPFPRWRIRAALLGRGVAVNVNREELRTLLIAAAKRGDKVFCEATFDGHRTIAVGVPMLVSAAFVILARGDAYGTKVLLADVTGFGVVGGEPADAQAGEVTA